MDATDRELEEAGLGQFLYARKSEYSYSGMLPPPDRFAEYDADTRERICRWNDAWTVDESRRQDRLVDNEIEQQNRASWMTFALLSTFCVSALVAFIATRDANSFWLLTVPVANVIGNLVKPAFSRSSRSD